MANKGFGDLLREYRLGMQLNQKELVAEVQHLGYRFNASDLCRYEAGIGIPNVTTFAGLVDALGLTPNEITRLVRASHPRPSLEDSKIPAG
jgi:hypothetical protein